MGTRKYWLCESPRSNVERPSKRVKIDRSYNIPINPEHRTIITLPMEILLEIFSYLSSQDLYVVRRVCSFFNLIVRDPVVWRRYEVMDNGMNTCDVIDELKRMPLLKKISIDARTDSDDILRQLSLTNKNLEELYISNCTGSTAKLYLRSIYLIRILERCNRLHTINILGTRFRGLKFYRLLADMGLRLRAASTPATCSQFRMFAKHARHIPEEGREAITAMCLGAKSWAPLHYFVVDRGGQSSSALVSYLYNDFITVDI